MNRDELLEAIRAAGRKGSRLELMRIVSTYPIDHATALEAFNEGLEDAERTAMSLDEDQET